MNNFKTAVYSTGTISAAGKMNYLRTLLRGKALREFDRLASQNTVTSNAHLKFIQDILLGFSPRLMPFPSRNLWCAVQCVNLAKSPSNDFPPISRNSTTASLFLPDREPPIRCPPNNPTRFSYTPSRTSGKNRPIYRASILRWRATKLHAICSK